MANNIYIDENYAIIGALFDVYNNLGSGFVGIVYNMNLDLEISLLKERSLML